ncbi:MAG: Rne/Rng family ribonuclease [Verrucomicrobia bacterium]|nr:Rne/Rng family ribonuclease [Verrucomicrobiota bacterium]
MSEQPSKKSTKFSEAELDQNLREPPVETVPEPLHSDQIKQQAGKRAKKSRPIISRVINAIKKQNPTFREIIINSEPLETRVAVLEDGVIERFEVERVGEDRLVGGVFKGKIQNLEPGLKAAFVDIGQPKNAFLHYWDIVPAANDSSIEIVRRNTKDPNKKKKKIDLRDIPKLYPIGTDIVVQITKGQIGTKGPRTTTNIALPGRYLVLMPFNDQCGISRKIEDNKERARLRKVIKSLTIPDGMGIIIRTAGEGKKLRYFIRDLHILLKTWSAMEKQIDEEKGAVCLYREPDIIERTVRDFLTEEVDRVLIDNSKDWERMRTAISQISKRSLGKINLFKDSIPIYERFNIERQIEQTFQRRVPLPSGGEIVIEETEALVAVDVNTGSHRNKTGKEKDYILQVNLESASEVARQIRLRNIGGLIIIDFIDMKNRRDRQSVFNRMRREMEDDKAKNHILPISQLGIMQMTRQRQDVSISTGLYTGCPYCNGRGIVKSPRTISVEIQRQITSVLRRLKPKASENDEDSSLTIRVMLNPTVLERLRSEDESLLVDIERLYDVNLSFRADVSYHMENFRLVNAVTGEELR